MNTRYRRSPVHRRVWRGGGMKVHAELSGGEFDSFHMERLAYERRRLHAFLIHVSLEVPEVLEGG